MSDELFASIDRHLTHLKWMCFVLLVLECLTLMLLYGVAVRVP